MRIETFDMERMQSVWENQVRLNLTESGVHAARLSELVDPSILGAEVLGYPQTNGSEALRSIIASDYPGATADHVLVTAGSAEANFLIAWNVLAPGDDMVMITPNYMQLWGAARGFGARAVALPLDNARGWVLDRDGLRAMVGPRTRLIAVCHPNNPTGSVLSLDDRQAICRAADAVGAWVLADEVYRGSEVSGTTAPSLWGMHERVLVVGGLSKAYGLPGLRIGWVVGPRDRIADLWRYKDYTTIAPSILSDRLARVALTDARPALLERGRAMIRGGIAIVSKHVEAHADIWRWTVPEAGAMAYLRYRRPIPSLELAERLRSERGILVVPGAHFGMEHYIRIGIAGEPGALAAGLDEITAELSTASTAT